MEAVCRTVHRPGGDWEGDQAYDPEMVIHGSDGEQERCNQELEEVIIQSAKKKKLLVTRE